MKDFELYFEVKKLPVAVLTARNPFNLKHEQVEAGAEQLFDEIRAGLKVKDVSLAHLVWSRAKKVPRPPDPPSKSELYIKDMRKITDDIPNIVAREVEKAAGRIEAVVKKRQPMSVDGMCLVLLIVVTMIMEALMIWQFGFGG